MFSIGCWNIILRVVQWVSGTLGVTLNTFLITLIIFRSPKDIGAYKYLMIYISAFEIAYSILDIIIEPHAFSHGPIFIVFRCFKDSFFTRDQGFYLIVVYCGSFGLSIALFGVHFVYRYGAADSEFRKSYLSGRKLIVLFLIPVVYGIWWSAVTFFLYKSSHESDLFISSSTSLLDGLETKIDEISYIIVWFYAPNPLNQNKIEPVWTSFVGIGCMWFMIFSSFFCVIYFGVKCYKKIMRKLKTSKMSSYYTKSIQQQLFQALVVQTLIPVFLMYIPVGVLFFFPMINFEVGSISSFVTATIAIYPAVDPLPTMFIVETYRKTLMCEFFEIFLRLCSSSFITLKRESQKEFRWLQEREEGHCGGWRRIAELIIFETF
ncbi:Protein CBG06398 [Caenorhabditis briggsae]|uniref:Serpentine receptor class r-10 n=1 Tax=Caenorhabditis briggsae TaxID=6238 RepID=A8X252_CAEBR|nr:Protein CBG06398 [Caenorhabditis briggsae]CAP26712.1 Protein CBG06398 [Caenorhabditis briggsae]